MHTKPVSELDGTFQDSKEIDYKCYKCGHDKAKLEIWESNCGGYEDEKVTRLNCKHVQWFDGIDS